MPNSAYSSCPVRMYKLALFERILHYFKTFLPHPSKFGLRRAVSTPTFPTVQVSTDPLDLTLGEKANLDSKIHDGKSYRELTKQIFFR